MKIDSKKLRYHEQLLQQYSRRQKGWRGDNVGKKYQMNNNQHFSENSYKDNLLTITPQQFIQQYCMKDPQ